jgi:hypothetical protein
VKVRIQRQTNLNELQFSFNGIESRFIELGLISLVWIWVTFPLPTILIFYNDAISMLLAVNGNQTYVDSLTYLQMLFIVVSTTIWRPTLYGIKSVAFIGEVAAKTTTKLTNPTIPNALPAHCNC